MRGVTIVGTALLALVLFVASGASADRPSARRSTVGIESGAAVYRNVCQGCHMRDGRGAKGAGRYPALARNPALENADYPITFVLNGHGGMPWFNGVLTDTQIADVVAYVRSHFGNDFKGQTRPSDVARLKGPAPVAEP